MDGPAALPLFIHSWRQYTPASAALGGSSPASAAWAAANRALYVPFVLPFRYPVARMLVANGSGVAGNFDVGIYAPDGTRLWSAGPTAQAGTSTRQYVTVSPDIILSPGRYLLAFWASTTTTARYLINSSAMATTYMRLVGMYQESSLSGGLPASATFAAVSSASYPLFGMTWTDSGF